ncbi:MAG TPA: DUF4012 domain-containing protein [Rugosimonospora sp.]|nr:DUF4012 domain-containing protein [Rugosimonospora sp.]
MPDEGKPPQEPPAQQSETGAGRYSFTPPDAEPHIEFKKVRRLSKQHPPRGRRLRRLHLVVTGAVVAGVLLLGTAWVGARGWFAATHLQRAAGLFAQLQQEVEHGDTGRLPATLAALQRETADAHSDTADAVWGLSTMAPLLGDDIRAVRTVAAALDDLTHRGLPPLVDVAGRLNDGVLSPKGGRVDLSLLVAAGPRILQADMAVRRAWTTVDGIRTAGLAPQLRAAVSQLDRGLRRADGLLITAARAAFLLPPMMGAKTPRTYLVLFQNLAETRATGGMPGAYIVVTADKGSVRIVDQGMANAAIRAFPKPVLPLNADQVGLYTDRPALFPADVNLTPDFPTAAKLYREMYRLRSGRTVDGVLATDPVALSYVLRATGPVAMPGGAPLSADTVVQVLLRQVYATMSMQGQDAYFAGAARATFDALTRRQANPRVLLAGLARSAGERRLLAWSAHPEEEQVLAGTVLAGQLPTDDGASPTVGVFLNDGSGAKLSYYLTHSASLRVGGCDPDGGRQLTLHLTLGSTAPPRGLPPYVLGLGLSGNPYVVRTNVMVFSPTGGSVVGATRDGAEADMGTGSEGDRQVGVFTVDLAPGARQTLDVTLLTADSPVVQGAVTPRLWTTPGVAPWSTAVTSGPGCRK